MANKRFGLGILAIVLAFSFSVVPAEAQVCSNPVRITVSGIGGFNGWDVEILLSSTNDLDDEDAIVAEGYADNYIVTAGSATFSLMNHEGRPFTVSGQYYIFLAFYGARVDRTFVSNSRHNIPGGLSTLSLTIICFMS